jgi:hypothetical protein
VAYRKGAGPESAATDPGAQKNVGSSNARSSKPQPQNPQAAPKSWRNVLPVHPAANLFPLMLPDELKALGEDIKKNGLREYIVTWGRGARPLLLDGRNRLDAAALVGLLEVHNGKLLFGGRELSFCAEHYAREHDPYALAVSFNIHRRHLTAEQKRELIAKLIKATPEKSDRQIAETVKASPTTVGTVRREVVSPTVQSGQLPPERIGKDGKVRKVANKPKQKVLSAPPKVSPAPAQSCDDIGSESNGERNFVLRLTSCRLQSASATSASSGSNPKLMK